MCTQALKLEHTRLVHRLFGMLKARGYVAPEACLPADSTDTAIKQCHVLSQSITGHAMGTCPGLPGHGMLWQAAGKPETHW